MKKTNRTLTIILLVLIVSCVQTDDFEIPKVEIEEINITANTNIQAIKYALDQSEEDIYTFNADDTSIMQGYVISSDEAGNFYKTLILQDNYENPSAGIEMSIDLKSYFTKYNFGRKVLIKMAGLSIANNEGKYIIGYLIKNKIEAIPEPLLNSYIIRTQETESIIPKKTSLTQLKNHSIGTYIQLENLQFRNDEVGKTFAGESFDEFNGDRILIQCENQINTILSTSTFSDFKSNLISDKKGTLSAVFTKDYYAKKHVLVLNDLTSFDFIEDERCDPSFLICDSNITNGSKLIFYENFQEVKKTKDLEALGWTNINAYLGNEKFNKRTSQGNVSMQISAYNSGENPLEAWLITPVINLDNSSNEILTFDTKASYDNGTILTAWVSTDFNKNISDATWQQLNVKISVGPGNTYVNDYISSGEINLECLDGDVFIALKYLGGDPGVSTTYDVDNFKIIGD